MRPEPAHLSAEFCPGLDGGAYGAPTHAAGGSLAADFFPLGSSGTVWSLTCPVCRAVAPLFPVALTLLLLDFAVPSVLTGSLASLLWPWCPLLLVGLCARHCMALACLPEADSKQSGEPQECVCMGSGSAALLHGHALGQGFPAPLPVLPGWQ